jgi:Flp pilus assembly protein TadD
MFEPWFYAGSLYRQFTQLQDSAILLLNRANTLRPNNTLVLKELGIAYGNIGDFTKAKEYLLQAEQLGANDAEIFHFIGVIYGMEGQDKLALSYFEKALALEPQNAIYIQDIAVARNRLGL